MHPTNFSPLPAPAGRHLVLASVCLAAIVLPLSFSGGAMATPDISRTLGGTPTELTWITNAFMLAFGSLLMAAGALADQYGRKRVFATGMGMFVLSSILLAMAPSVLCLDMLRALQGVAAAGSLAGGSAALAQEFEGRDRTRAFGLLGSSFGLGLAFGPMIAGGWIAWLGWRAIFVFIATVAALAMMFGLPRMRETRDPDAAGLDWPGTVTFTAMLALLTFGIIQAPVSGWEHPAVIALLAAAAAMLVAFVMIESKVRRPMLELSLFRYPRFIGVQVLPIGTCYGYIVLVVLLPLRLIGVEGMSELQAGLYMLALSAPMLFMPLIAARLAHRFAPRVLCSAGFIGATLGLGWLSVVSWNHPTSMVPPLVLIGLGTGLPWGLMDGLAVSVVPRERAGMATGIFSTTRVAGEGIALASVGAVLAWIIKAALSHASPALPPAAMANASQRLAMGELRAASFLLQPLRTDVLGHIYNDAFHVLLLGLAAINMLCAITVFGVMRAPQSVILDQSERNTADVPS